MAEITVTVAEMVRASTGIKSSADALDQRVRALISQVEALLSGGWKGQAADAFQRDWERWLHGAKEVVGGLDSSAALLTSNADAYQRRENANSERVTGASSGLNMEV